MRFKTTQTFLPGFAPRAPAPARLDDPKTRVRIEQVAELAVSCIDVYRPHRKREARAPIDRADITKCRRDIIKMLREERLPVPDDAWLDDLIIELAGWWFEFPLAADVPAPQIDVLHEPPRPSSRAPAFDGPAVGWDPWEDP